MDLCVTSRTASEVRRHSKHLAFQRAGHLDAGKLSISVERRMLYTRSVKTHSENHGRIRRRKSPNSVNSKLIMAAVRLWELKRRNPAR
jgi:hypothetical protein